MDKMDQKPFNHPLDHSELAKLPRNIMSKSMRDSQDIMADYIADPDKISPEEERLVDLIVFEKTGQHIGKFKSQEPKTKFDGLVISKDGDGHGQVDLKLVDINIPNEPEISSKVVTKGSEV